MWMLKKLLVDVTVGIKEINHDYFSCPMLSKLEPVHHIPRSVRHTTSTSTTMSNAHDPRANHPRDAIQGDKAQSTNTQQVPPGYCVLKGRDKKEVHPEAQHEYLKVEMKKQLLRERSLGKEEVPAVVVWDGSSRQRPIIGAVCTPFHLFPLSTYMCFCMISAANHVVRNWDLPSSHPCNESSGHIVQGCKLPPISRSLRTASSSRVLKKSAKDDCTENGCILT